MVNLNYGYYKIDKTIGTSKPYIFTVTSTLKVHLMRHLGEAYMMRYLAEVFHTFFSLVLKNLPSRTITNLNLRYFT